MSIWMIALFLSLRDPATGMTRSALERIRSDDPPQVVLMCIPTRLGRLKSGMSWRETSAVLGLGRSWLAGGVGARPYGFDGNGHYWHESYAIGPIRKVTVRARVGGIDQDVQIERSRALIELWFDTDPDANDPQTDPKTRLNRFTFAIDGRVVAASRP